MSCEKNWITAFKVKVTVKGKNVSVYPDVIFYTTQQFVTKLGIVMPCCEFECMQKDWFTIFKVKIKVIAGAHNDQNVMVSTISAEPLIILLPNLV